jgi:hypothetical protein
MQDALFEGLAQSPGGDAGSGKLLKIKDSVLA